MDYGKGRMNVFLLQDPFPRTLELEECFGTLWDLITSVPSGKI